MRRILPICLAPEGRTRAISSLFAGFLFGMILAASGCSEDAGPAGGGAAMRGDAGNLLPNPSFEEREGQALKGWEKKAWRGDGVLAYAPSGREGGSCVLVQSDGGVDAAWQAGAPVKLYSRYRLAGWIKTEGVDPGTGRGALLNVHNLPGVQTRALQGTQDWTRVETYFETGGADWVQINCLLGGWGKARGKAWFDDVSLECVRAAELEPKAVIRADQEQAPISPYIFGQFIEHLGRCIYGGIWAEMLQDRKFFFAPGAAESPWTTLAEEPRIVMVTGREALTGLQSPRIGPATGESGPAGLCQGGLALIKGKEYVGRIQTAAESEGARLEVRLRWGEGPEACATETIDDPPREYTAHPLHFVAGEDAGDGRLEIVLAQGGPVRVGAVSLMPADNEDGFRADTLALMRELRAPVYRWPGGNFVSGYDWRDGIGDRDRRPPRKNPAWQGIEPNDVGIHEFIALCRKLEAEPYIAVNTGLGGAESAADEVEYANGGPETPLGRLRAQNGSADPFRVAWWGIGNEMYGDWQLGHVPLEDYEAKQNNVVDAMRGRDPAIRCIAVGNVGPWSEGMLTQCADHMDAISEHFYCGEEPGLYGHAAQIPRRIRQIAEAHRAYRAKLPSLKDRAIPVAVDEWNYWYGPYRYGELGTQYFLKDALGIARGLHEFFRNSDLIFMANYAQCVNVIGCIKTTRRDTAFDTTGLVLRLYRNQYGRVPVPVTGSMDPLDVAAAWSEDGKTLTVGIVNASHSPYVLDLEIEGAVLSGEGCRWLLEGAEEKSCNVPGQEPAVRVRESSAQPSRTIEVPALSCLLYAFPAERRGT